jgi:hypothetical protein
MLLALLALTLAPLPPHPVADPAPCKTMNTEGLPLAKRQSPLDSVSFKVGNADVKVCYGRPSARGRAIMGGVVPYGKLWRTGANEPTMIHTSAPIKVAGIDVPAGTYSLYTVPGETEWEVIVNKSTSQWGHESTYTDAVKAQELGRGKVKAGTTSAPVEQFTIRADSHGSMVHLALEWEKTRVEIPITPGR